MRRGRRRDHRRLRTAALTVPLLAPLLLTGVPATGASPSPVTRPVTAAPSRGDVQVRIDDVTPSVVPRSTTRQPLQIRFTLTNTSGAPLSKVVVQGVRGEPIGNQKALDASIADASPPTDGIAVPTARPLTLDLPTSAPVSATFATTISVLDDGQGLCQCLNAVYPVRLVARASDDDGAKALGSATTYIPSQVDKVTPVKVSWVWPLLDRPHRLGDDTVFADDDLASSVSGGRLDRALQVLERLKATTPITVVVDPELLDELEVMAGGNYTVRVPKDTTNGTTGGSSSSPTSGATNATEPGTGQVVARAWLDRFAAVLRADRAVQVSLTPYADPDIQTLTRNDLTWATVMPAQMQQRVTAALLGRPLSTDVAWPAGGVVSPRALDAMATSGVRTIVVDGSALSPRSSGGIPVALARLRSSDGAVTAAATSPVMQRQVAQAIDTEQSGPTGANALPYLISEIAVRALQTGDNPSYAVLTPPRYVDPVPERAARTIEDTGTSAFATPVAVRSLTEFRPGRTSTLRASAPASSSISLPDANVEAAADTASGLPSIVSLLSRDPAVNQLRASLSRAAQRVTSSAWRPVAGSPIVTTLGPELAGSLDDEVRTLLDGVRIITPSSGSYTLGSRDSALPITVENTLPYVVTIDLEVKSLGGVPGYTMRDIGTQRITADAKQTVQVPSRLDRSGRIPVNAQLITPTGRPLGDPVLLYVRSTVFGTIGIVITLVAGGVLALALIVRLIRRLQRLRRKSERAAEVGADDAEDGTDGTEGKARDAVDAGVGSDRVDTSGTADT